MEMLFAATGILGALSCVGMYAAVSLGHASTERTPFFIINGAGALLVMIATWHNFDIGDAGTILQEIVWMGLSIAGGLRVGRFRGQRKARRSRPAHRSVLHPVRSSAAGHQHSGESIFKAGRTMRQQPGQRQKLE